MTVNDPLTEISSKKSNLLVSQKHEVDLSRAIYSTSLSSASIDDETQLFYITIDKVLYQHPVEVIEKVLRANGFSLNLENILACMDDFKIGTSVQLDDEFADPDEPLSFIHCIQFRLPQKTSVGPTLSKFYEEIESYESIIADLKGSQANKDSVGKREAESKKRIQELEAENRSLKMQLRLMQSQLESAVKSVEKANETLESQNYLPSNVFRATVREINIEDRMVIVKSGKTTINIPLFMCDILPEAGDHCLVHVEQGNTLGCFFFNKERKHLQPQLAKVILVKNSICKIRDENRNTWLIKAKNSVEYNFFRTLKNNDHLLIYLLKGKPLRFESLLRPEIKPHTDSVQETIQKFQIAKLEKVKPMNEQSNQVDGERK
ncbi:hypothetical protein [Spartinivicinus poritis]|uniref:Uncharacterized protein n=1 Tax=Spartinivicinus poritis TaxID=2994640 RepID=A0ABT5UCY2_9GAMM|nr:hypothetical protein [Spartinivicinus sp. A2-2]MDE1464238.1 hypothetical protein [Spartinivicinus sp. A2-2]